MSQAIKRLRLNGIRKLNWVPNFSNLPYDKHLHDTGFDEWLEFSSLSIIIGTNGGGKTTVIDLLRCLSNTSLWPTLPRENYPGTDFSGFDIEGYDYSINARFFTPELDYLNSKTLFLLGVVNGTALLEKDINLPKYYQTGVWETKIQNILSSVINFKINYLSSASALSITEEELVDLLNELSPNFSSILINDELKRLPFRNGGIVPPYNGRIGVLFKDDPGHHSYLLRDYLPQGWQQIASVLYFIRSCEDNSVILLDEPDRHLHPHLQRVLLEVISHEITKKNIQVFIATHSSVLLNPELINSFNAKVFQVSGGKLSTLNDTRRLLDDLGVKSSDLIQANGIIWVEGPSDRIYIKTWLELYNAMDKSICLVEGIHYSIVHYGGSLMKHLTLSSNLPDKINLSALNRNWFLVIDSDLSEEKRQPLKKEKERLFAEANSINLQQNLWITKEYTIEAYLPSTDAFQPYINTKKGRVSVVGKTKVELAEHFRQRTKLWQNSFKEKTELPERIASLLKIVKSWQMPEEL